MKKRAVIIETQDGVINSANYGMIACASKGATELYCFIINENDEHGDKFREELEKYGIKNIVGICIDSTCQKDHEKSFNPVKWSDAIAQAVIAYHISTLFGLTTPVGKELLPRIAAQLDAPLVMDCLDVSQTYNTVNEHTYGTYNDSDHDFDLAKTSLYSGKTIATVKVTGSIRIFGIRPNVITPSTKSAILQAAESSPSQATASINSSPSSIEKFIANYTPQQNIKLVESRKGDSLGNHLLAADVIISGGRAMQNGENFKLLEDCARAIENLGGSAAVGASRVAVDLGWVPYRMQVGQTGEKVSPKVYIACGISGSVQHFAGMKMSKMIIAINENPNAAIMSSCDYHVESDVFEILPALIEELQTTQ